MCCEGPTTAKAAIGRRARQLIYGVSGVHGGGSALHRGTVYRCIWLYFAVHRLAGLPRAERRACHVLLHATDL